MKKQTEKFAILIRKSSRDIRHGDGYGVIELSVVDISSGQVRNPGCDHKFHDLQFRCQWDTASKLTDYTYAWEIAYRDSFAIRLRDAQRMLKVLRAAENAFRKAKVRPLTFGQYVTVVALALGINSLQVESIHSAETLTYSERDFHSWDISDAALILDTMIHIDRYPETR